MQKGKTSKFVPKLGLVLWMLPLSSWAVSGTIPEANSALTSYAHEAREIDAIAQSAKKRTVTGTITDASDGTPIIGANIVVKGSQTGVISDLDGNYSIEVSSKDVLVISFIGYKTREVPVVDLGVINVKLQSDNEMLDEVVVVGAGTQKKVSVTGSITSVKGSSPRYSHLFFDQCARRKAGRCHRQDFQWCTGTGCRILYPWYRYIRWKSHPADYAG